MSATYRLCDRLHRRRNPEPTVPATGRVHPDALMAAPTDEDRAALAYLAARRGEGEATVAAMTPTASQPATGRPTSRPTMSRPATSRPAPDRPAPAVQPAADQQPRPATPPPAPEPAEAEWRPGLGAQLRDLGALPDDEGEPRTTTPPVDDDATRRIPNQRLPRRMPSADSSWTARDRANQ